MHHATLYKIRDNGYFGFIDSRGEVVITPQYLEVGAFHHGFASVQLNGQWVPIDTLGRLLLKKFYRYVGQFEHGLARVQVVRHWGYLNQQGDEAILPFF